MPCYEQRVVSVKLAAMDLAILEPALKAAGFQVSKYTGSNTLFEVVSKKGTWASIVIAPNGDREVRTNQGMESIVDEIKQAYAFGVVQEVTKYGWDVSFEGNEITLNQHGGGEQW